MDDAHSVRTTHTRVVEPHKIPLPPSVLDDYAEKKKDLEKGEKPKEPQELQHRNVDDDTRFWQTYVSEAGKFDKELIESWNDNLDSLLLFAALFSAINTAFIIEAYKRLQPDPMDSTNSILKLILAHRNDGESIPESQLEKTWSPPSDAVRLNAILFASLACSLLASFGAILGKEMLAEYKNSGALSTLPEQGRKRQRKYDGLKRYRFRLLMQILPILLQFSLALFLMGIIDFLWRMSLEVAIVIVIPAAVGFIAYVVSMVVAIRQEDSPFQTSLSKSLRLLLPALKKIFQSLTKSAINLRTFLASRPPQPWNQLRLLVRPIKYRLSVSPIWLALTSKVRCITQTLRTSRGSRVVEQSFSTITTILYVCGLGLVGWCVEVWQQINFEILMTLYVAGLGVFGGIVAGVEFLASTLGLSRSRRAESSDNGVKRDVVSGDCAVWLLENSQDPEVLHKALETLPLLPADLLLERFKTQPKILDRYVLMYMSTLQRRPGDVDFRMDEVRTRDAIASGTALFHVLKSRRPEDWSNNKGIDFGADPELSGAVDDAEGLSKFDLSLLAVFLCVQTQSGGGGVEYWDFNLLRNLLERFLATLRTKSSTIESPDISPQPHADSPTPTTPSITLLLDAGIFVVSQKYLYEPQSSAVTYCGGVLESILVTIHAILEHHPVSMTLTSHIALLIAATQWYKQKAEDAYAVESEELEYNGVKLGQLRKAWFAVDKRADFFDNVILAFRLVGTYDSTATVEIYVDLLRSTEHFLPRIMDVSWKHSGWNKWWSKTILIIPGLLRLLPQLNLYNRPEVGHTAVRIIARLLPDDWYYDHAIDMISQSANAPLQVISPCHPAYGSDMTELVTSVLSSSNTLVSPQTRRSVAEILAWMIICPGVIGQLPSLVDDPYGMYQQYITVPPLFMSMITDQETSSRSSLYQYHYKVLLTMIPNGSLSASVQLEALTLALANIYRSSTILEGIWISLDRMTISEEDAWPMFFVGSELADWIVYGEGSSQRSVIRLRVNREPWTVINDPLTPVWSGEALLIIWRKLSRQKKFDAPYPLYIFRRDVILAILDSFNSAIDTNHQISCQSMIDYLTKAVELGWVDDGLKNRIDKTMSLLKVASTDGWDTSPSYYPYG